MANGPKSIALGLKRAGIRLILTVPDEWSRELIQLIEEDSSFKLIYATREEEGVGIAAGAEMGGLRTAILMQTSGLGNSINALASLNLVYRIPCLILASYRGGPGEEFYHKLYIGLSVKGILGSLGIPCYEANVVRGLSDVILNASKQAESWNIPAVVLLHKDVLVGEWK